MPMALGLSTPARCGGMVEWQGIGRPDCSDGRSKCGINQQVPRELPGQAGMKVAPAGDGRRGLGQLRARPRTRIRYRQEHRDEPAGRVWRLHPPRPLASGSRGQT